MLADTGESGAEDNPEQTWPGDSAMYSLTLAADEQRAFDWVGDRYNSGKVADFLLDCIPDDRECGDDADATSPSGSA